jgi:hypothetical protein
MAVCGQMPRGAGQRAGTGLRLARNSGPLVHMVPSGRRSSRGSRRCAGVPADELGVVAALGPDGCPPLLEVESSTLKGQDLTGPGGGLIQHPPQRLFPQRDVAARQQPLDAGPDSALVVSLCSVRRSALPGSCGASQRFLLADQFSQDTTAAPGPCYPPGAPAGPVQPDG